VFSEPILHVDMDAFFVEVERLRRPELRERVVVVGGAGPRSVVAAASYEARRFGIRSAMPMVEARRRARELVIVPPDHGEYGRVSELVFAIFRDVTPLVEGLSIDEAFLDVSGLRLHHPSPSAVADLIRSRIRTEIGLPASVGVAASKFMAKLASQDAKPDGVKVVPAATQLDYLWQLPVGRMWGVGAATGATLARLGVGTIGDLASIGETVLARELGPSLAGHLGRLANAEDPRGVVPDTETKSISVEETYDVDLVGFDQVRAALRTHADRVGRRVRRAGVRGKTVTVKLRYSDFTTITRSSTIPAATDVGREIFSIACELTERALDRDRPVRLLGVGLSGLVSETEPEQLSVITDDRRRALDSAVDAVRDRFGSGIVETPGGGVGRGASHQKSDRS
jgi:nucleotidyltransferase/DNA polymerase involved in DNA repair